MRPTLEYIFAHIIAPKELFYLAQFAHISGIQLRLLLLLLAATSRSASHCTGAGARLGCTGRGTTTATARCHRISTHRFSAICSCIGCTFWRVVRFQGCRGQRHRRGCTFRRGGLLTAAALLVHVGRPYCCFFTLLPCFLPALRPECSSALQPLVPARSCPIRLHRLPSHCHFDALSLPDSTLFRVARLDSRSLLKRSTALAYHLLGISAQLIFVFPSSLWGECKCNSVGSVWPGADGCSNTGKGAGHPIVARSHGTTQKA